jgi:aspartate racemase
MLNVPAQSRFANSFHPIGIIAGSGPEAGVDLWSKVLLASRAVQGGAYEGDTSAPLVRIVSDPALGLSISPETEPIVDHHLKNCVSELTATCTVFTIACNALQARAKELIPAEKQHAFCTFDVAVDAAVSKMNARSFFLIGSSTVMSLSPKSIYASLKEKYSIQTPSDWDNVDALIQDIKLTGGIRPDLVQRLETLVAEGGALPVVLACTDFPLVPACFRNQITIDATEALATFVVKAATRVPANPVPAPAQA